MPLSVSLRSHFFCKGFKGFIYFLEFRYKLNKRINSTSYKVRIFCPLYLFLMNLKKFLYLHWYNENETELPVNNPQIVFAHWGFFFYCIHIQGAFLEISSLRLQYGREGKLQHVSRFHPLCCNH